MSLNDSTAKYIPNVTKSFVAFVNVSAISDGE